MELHSMPANYLHCIYKCYVDYATSITKDDNDGEGNNNGEEGMSPLAMDELQDQFEEMMGG